MRITCKVEVTWGREIWKKREETGEEMNMEVTDGVDGQRMVGMDVGLIDYKIKTIFKVNDGRGCTLDTRENDASKITKRPPNTVVSSDVKWMKEERNGGEKIGR